MPDSKPESKVKEISPTEATFREADRKGLDSRLTKMREAIRQVLTESKDVESEQVTKMRQILLKALEEDRLAEQKRQDVILAETLARDERKEVRRVDESQVQDSASSNVPVNEPDIAFQSMGSLKRSQTSSDLSQVFGSPQGESQPRTRRRSSAISASGPPSIDTILANRSHIGDPLLTARPFVASVAKSSQQELSSPQPFVPASDSTANLVDLPPSSPPWQEGSTAAHPNPQIINDKVVMTPYMTPNNLKKVYDNLPRKLRDLLNPNSEGYWPYIQDWYRNQREEDLDEATIELCVQMPLSSSRGWTLFQWNQNVEWGRKVRAKEREEVGHIV